MSTRYALLLVLLLGCSVTERSALRSAASDTELSQHDSAATDLDAGPASKGGDQGEDADVPSDALARLYRDTGVAWLVANNRVTGGLGTLGTVQDSGIRIGPNQTAETRAMDFFAKYRDLFGMKDPRKELRLDATHVSSEIDKVKFIQTEGGIDVRHGSVSVEFKRDGSLSMITASFFPDLSGVDTKATLTPSAAIAIAAADMPQHYPRNTLGSRWMPPADTKLVVYAEKRPARLAYSFTLGWTTAEAERAPKAPLAYGATVGIEYLVDANTGAVLDAQTTERMGY